MQITGDTQLEPRNLHRSFVLGQSLLTSSFRFFWSGLTSRAFAESTEELMLYNNIYVGI